MREKLRAVLLVGLMVLSVVAVSGAFTGSTGASVTDIGGVSAENVSQGTSVTQTVTIEDVSDDGSGDVLTVKLNGASETTIDGVNLNTGLSGVQASRVAPDQVNVTVPSGGSTVTGNITLDLTLTTDTQQATQAEYVVSSANTGTQASDTFQIEHTVDKLGFYFVASEDSTTGARDTLFTTAGGAPEGGDNWNTLQTISSVDTNVVPPTPEAGVVDINGDPVDNETIELTIDKGSGELVVFDNGTIVQRDNESLTLSTNAAGFIEQMAYGNGNSGVAYLQNSSESAGQDIKVSATVGSVTETSQYTIQPKPTGQINTADLLSNGQETSEELSIEHEVSSTTGAKDVIGFAIAVNDSDPNIDLSGAQEQSIYDGDTITDIAGGDVNVGGTNYSVATTELVANGNVLVVTLDTNLRDGIDIGSGSVVKLETDPSVVNIAKESTNTTGVGVSYIDLQSNNIAGAESTVTYDTREVSNLNIVGQGSNARITEGDSDDVSVLVRNPEGGSRTIDVSLDIGNGAVTTTKTTSQLAVGGSEPVVFTGVTGNLPVGEHTVNVTTANSTTTGTIEVLEPVSDADSEVAVAVTPPSDSSIASDTVEIFAGAYTETNTTRVGLPNKDLTLDVTDLSGSSVIGGPKTVTTGKSGNVTYTVSGIPTPGQYEVNVSGFSSSATARFTRGPVIDIMNNRDSGILLGDQTTVSAVVRDGEGSVGGEPVDVTVTNASGTDILNAQKTTDPNGFVNVTFTPQTAGEYTVETRTTTGLPRIDIVTLQAANATLGSDYDFRNSIPGEESVYGGYVRTADGQLTNTNLTVTFTNVTATDVVLERNVTTDENGFFLIDYQTPSDVDDAMSVSIQRENGETVHARFEGIYPDDGGTSTASDGTTIRATIDKYRVTPGETVDVNIKAVDGSGNPLAGEEIDVYAGIGSGGVPALSDTVVTDSDGKATMTLEVPQGAENRIDLRGTAAFVHDGEIVSDSFFARVQQFDVTTDWNYVPGDQSEFSVDVVDRATGDAVSGFPVQFAALYANHKIDSIVTGELVTDASGSASTTVSIPSDVGPQEEVNELHRYATSGTNDIVRPEYPGTLTVGTNAASPGQQVNVEFVTPNGENASGIVFGTVGNPRGSLGTDVVGDEPTTLTIPQYAEAGDSVRLTLWAYGEGRFYTDNVFLTIEQASGGSDDSTEQQSEQQQQELTEGPAIDVDDSAIDFGDVRVGEDETANVTVTNGGDEDLTLDISLEGDDAFDSVATVGSEKTIDPGESATYDIEAEPTEPGDFNGTLVFDTNAGTEEVDLAARGVQGEFELVTGSVDFGTVAVGATPTESVVVRNNGTASVGVGDIAVGGESAFFELDTDGGFVLSAGEERSIGLTYRPEEAGTNQATVTVDDPEENRYGTVDVVGEARESRLTATATALEFGQQSVGDSATREITIEPTVDQPVDGVELAIDSQQFTVPDELGTLNESRTVTVAYEPTRRGAHNATLRVSSGNATEATVPLSGTASAPELQVTPESVQFDDTTVSDAVAETVVVENVGDEPLTVNRTNLSRSDVFELDDGAPFTLDDGESRELSVRFTPENETSTSAYLRIESNAPTRPNRIVSLSSGNIETTVEVDEEGRTTTSTRVRNVESGEEVEIDLPDSDEEGYETENVSVVPEEEGDLEVNITSSEQDLETTPDTDAGFENGTKQVGNISAETNLDNENIEEVQITTRVNESRLEEINSSAEDVVLERYNETQERWVEQETDLVRREGGDAILQARGDGFSEWTAAAKTPVLNISDTNIDVQTATTEDDVTIQVLVTNTGGADGSYEAVLFQNDEEIDRQERTVPNGGTVGINFERSFADPGLYQLEVNEVFVGEVNISAAEQDVEVEEVENPSVEANEDGTANDDGTEDSSTADGGADDGTITEGGDSEETDDGGLPVALLGGILVVVILAGAGGVYYRQQQSSDESRF